MLKYSAFPLFVSLLLCTHGIENGLGFEATMIWLWISHWTFKQAFFFWLEVLWGNWKLSPVFLASLVRFTVVIFPSMIPFRSYVNKVDKLFTSILASRCWFTIVAITEIVLLQDKILGHTLTNSANHISIFRCKEIKVLISQWNFLEGMK